MESLPPVFKAPSSVPQDLAIIMGFVDFPEREDQAFLHHSKKVLHSSTLPVEDDSISSSGTESEDEVEAEIIAEDNGRKTVVMGEPGDIKPSDSCSESSYSSSEGSSRSPSPVRNTIHEPETDKPPFDEDIEDDGPPLASAYIASTHEVSLTAIPIPPLPELSAIPPDPLHRVGEIINVLRDTVIIRASSAIEATERRDAVLDEGSLLLFDDRTPLGYVWETFGPTSLPHYVVRINQKLSTPSIVDPSNQESSNTNDVNITQSLPNPSKLVISEVVYHIPSLSNFVFSSALVKYKGSDASNLHDEEPAENEVDFSDDEAEAAHKRRLRGRSSSRVPSLPPFSRHYDGDNEDPMSAMGDDAQSLYGDSPYDYNDVEATPHSDMNVPLTPKAADLSAMDDEQHSEIRRALINARNSRNRRLSVSTSSEASSFVNLSVAHSTGRGRGRGRGRGGGRGRGRGGHQPMPTFQSKQQNGTSLVFFDNDEYDPRMPRLSSPTSMSIAGTTNHWSDGSSFAPGLVSQGCNPNPAVQSLPHISMQYLPPPQYSQIPASQHGLTTVPGYIPAQNMLYTVPPHLNPNFPYFFKQPTSAEISGPRPSHSGSVSHGNIPDGDPPDI